MQQNYITKNDLLFTGHDLSGITNDELLSIMTMASFLADAWCMQTIGKTSVVDEVFTDIKISNYGFEIHPVYSPIIAINKIQLIDDINNYNINLSKCVIDNTSVTIYVMQYYEAFLGKISYDYGYNIIPDDFKQGVALICLPLIDQFFTTKITGFSDVMQIQEYQEKIIRKTPEIVYKLEKYKRYR